MTVPCSCCPTGGVACALTPRLFGGVAQTLAQPGWTPSNLPLTIDGTVSAVVSGYGSPAGVAPTPTPEVTYTLGALNAVVGLRLWNQGGGNLNDADGLGAFTADFYAGAALLYSFATAGVNGGAAQTLLLPGGILLNAVDRVVLRSLAKLVAGTAAPLWRELQILTLEPVFGCLTGTVLRWFRENGSEADIADVQACPPGASFNSPTVSTLTMNAAAFGDGPDSLGENLCAVTPLPSATTNLSAPVAGCYDPTVAGNVSMTWAGPLSQVDLQYGNPPRTSGGVIVSFTSPETAAITWPTNLTPMAPGETRLSNPTPTGGHAEFTYVSGPANANAPRMEGAGSIGLHRVTTDAGTPPIKFRLTVHP